MELHQHEYFVVGVEAGGGTSRKAFVKMRQERDAALAVPTLILRWLQVNMRAGEVPKDADGSPALKVPLNVL